MKAGLLLCSLAGLLAVAPVLAAAEEIMPLGQLQHIHGIAVDPTTPGRLFLASHHGLFAASPDGLATRVSTSRADFMSLAVSPGPPEILYASGHPPQGGNLGLVASQDGGTTWQQLYRGGDEAVDFHALTVSPVNSNLIYGVYKDLQVSRDGGRIWSRVADAPPRLFDLAASARDEKTLYLASGEGLSVSRDGGRTWSAAFMVRRPATMVHVSATGTVYAFIYKTGLFVAQEPGLDWKLVSKDFQGRALMKLAISPSQPQRLFAIADTGQVMTSGDGGRTWTNFEGYDKMTAAGLASGGRLYAENCQACHGLRGVGERPDDMYAKDEHGYVAPPLNDSAHGWHHSDPDLANLILDGSPRNPRMVPWKETLSRKDAENLVVYIKGLWNFNSLACQGSRHMKCVH